MNTTLVNNNSLILTAYAIYIPIAIILTIWTAHMLFKNGKVFMLEIFHGNEALATSTNRLFEIGYFLLNIGCALKILEISFVDTTQSMIEALCSKIGGFTIWLGIVFMLNVVLFIRGRKNANRPKQELNKVIAGK